MGILVIGDRYAGKTQFINALAQPQAAQRVTPSEGWSYIPPEKIQRTGVGTTEAQLREIRVTLPSGFKQLLLEVMDTPGEVWSSGEGETFSDWQAIQEVSATSEGIFLILPPYDDLLKAEEREQHSFGDKVAWVDRFQGWVQFFRNHCPKAQHILLCISKADLFEADIGQLASRFAYAPNGSVGWDDRHQYLLHRSFKPIAQDINALSQWKQQGSPGSVQCFLTSIHHRSLLELPWIYLASYLSPSN